MSFLAYFLSSVTFTEGGGGGGEPPPDPGEVPDSPTNMAVSAASDSSLSCTWTDNSDDEDGFKLYVGGVYNKTVAADSTSTTITGLDEGTQYTVMVRAYNGIGQSGGSSDSAYTQLSAPTGFVGIDKGSYVRFSWTNVSGKAAQIEIHKDAALHAAFGPSFTQYDESEPGSDGTWKVRAVHSVISDSDFSNSASGPPWPE